MSTEIHRFTWQEIEIELTYEPVKWKVIAHLEVRSIEPKDAPLPITETGYKSHFHPIGTIEQSAGTLVEQVTAWLDEAVQSKAWQKHVEDSRQFALF